MIDFNCSRCGKCCTNILTNINGNTFGLYLSVDDSTLFPSEVVFPLFGRGDPIQIKAYQLGVNQCPHFQLGNSVGSCLIHEKKPLACRTFPLLSYDRFSKKLVLCKSCPVVKTAYDKGEEFNKDSLISEISANNQKIEQLIKEITDNNQDEYMWPINKKEWIKISDIYEKNGD